MFYLVLYRRKNFIVANMTEWREQVFLLQLFVFLGYPWYLALF